MIGISACLGGKNCRYDGKDQKNMEMMYLIENGNAILICPEVLGGMRVPRNPAEIQSGNGIDVWAGKAKVLDNQGKDVTEAFKRGAIQAYEQLKAAAIDIVILKERSPSCGSNWVYDGSFTGKVLPGGGVTTAYFRAKGIRVYSEENWKAYLSQDDS